MHELIIPNGVKKDLKRLDKPVIETVIALFEEIAENPYAGVLLQGDMSFVYKKDFYKQGTSYRIAYTIVDEYVQVKVVHVGSRENFYNELKRRL